MNKKTHRLIFNKSRGCLIAVGDNARSGGGGCSGARRSKRRCCTVDSGVGANSDLTVQGSAGNGTTYTNSQVVGNSVQIDSGGDTTLRGGVVRGEQVTANVGGNLIIESLQDTNRFNEKSQSVGGSVTLGPASGFAWLPNKILELDNLHSLG